jgi:signal transduction histidine kinase
VAIWKPPVTVTIRTALLLGFGLTLVLWLFSGLGVAQKVSEVQAETDAINGRYRRAQESLSIARSQMLLGSLFVRDALLEPDPAAFPAHLRRIDDAFESADQALRQYVPVLNSEEEGQRISRLRNEIDELRQTTRQVLGEEDVVRLPAEGRLRLLLRVIPKRENAVQVSEEVQGLNRRDFVQQQAEVADVYAAMRRRTLWQLSLILLASLTIGMLATRHVVQLEGRLREQQAKDWRNTRDLQQLSARLMTIQEEERRRISRDLHDEVGQVLTAIKVDLAVAERFIEGAGGATSLLSNARTMAEGALQTVRDLSRLLHPTLLHDLGLPVAVDVYSRDFGQRHGIRVDVSHEGMERRRPTEVELAAYRIVQEGLTNVAKHAGATRAHVSLRSTDEGITIMIEDNGIGFDAAAESSVESTGLGLVGIRERVARLGGSFTLNSLPGQGARLTVFLPGAAQDFPAAQEEAGVDPVERRSARWLN